MKKICAATEREFFFFSAASGGDVAATIRLPKKALTRVAVIL